MATIVRDVLLDPVVGRIVAAGFVVLVVHSLARFAARLAQRRVQQQERRYRVRKLIDLGEYVVIFPFLALIFTDRLRGLTVFLALVHE